LNTTNPDVSIATRLAPKANLLAIHFAQVGGQILEIDPLEGELAWTLSPIQVLWGGDGKDLRVLVPYKLAVTKSSHGSQPKPVAELYATLRIDYTFPPSESFSDDDLTHFACISGVMHSWPYFRSEVQALTTKMELPPLTLPLLLSGQIAELATVRKLSEAELRAAPPRTSQAATEQAAG
jgi:hypothetical protein